ncbi:MAG: PDDEXK nuclease domain-containing protein [Bacteroidota bacterium]|nr:PDDEXK nuclease domain-containing protein [Bacteroidota bacterium]
MTNYIEEIKAILLQARQKAYTTVNTAMVEAYWMIGKRIVDQEQHGENRAAYGENILKELSKSLTGTFGKGFSYSNLYNFRQFYLTYSEQDKFYTLCRKLTWSHNRLIMRVENIEARKYYLTEAAEQNWSVRTLERNIETFYYHRILSSGKLSNKLELSSLNEHQQPEDFIKDPYIFEFLNIQQPIDVKESAIETALIENLQQFLLELGKGFSFIGRQYRISTETDHFYIDLVFYNYLLKCFVLIDLKAGKLSHQHIGQMDMYRRLFDDLKKPEGDNPTIGIILCTEKSETVVKYSVINDNPRLFATKYMPYLPTEAELIAEIEREKLKLNFSNEDDKINNN